MIYFFYSKVKKPLILLIITHYKVALMIEDMCSQILNMILETYWLDLKFIPEKLIPVNFNLWFLELTIYRPLDLILRVKTFPALIQ